MARDIVRWDPFRELESLRREMERLFDTFLGERRFDRNLLGLLRWRLRSFPISSS